MFPFTRNYFRYQNQSLIKRTFLTTKRGIMILAFIWCLPICYMISKKEELTTHLIRKRFDCRYIFTAPETTTTLNTVIRKNFTTPPQNVANISKNAQRSVIFLKTHKTGSSTITNIMQRYSKSNKLNVALPKCEHRFCYPEKFDKNLLFLHTKGNTYNMLFNHAVFYKEKMLKVMDPGTKIITIIREPYSQFDSAVQYLNFKKYFNLSGILPLLDEFFKIPEESLKSFLQSVNLLEGEGSFALAKNPNAFDLGFDVWNETPEYINEVLNSISQDFHLVMIMEYMEESLVLLKNELNWELEDVVFFVHNARKFKDKNTNNINDATKKVLNWNKLDAAIYKHFNETFWVKVKTSPPEFYTDVKTLREWNLSLVNHCTLYKTTDVSNTLIKKYSEKNRAYLCTDILKEDIPFTVWFKMMRQFNSRSLFSNKW
ncbi:galactose-3-O-sulfotransferase 3 isoform X1 [Hydra vulgaris]|uniref:galactose-3-O-sulfotransferase 3 isoform X1 n=1 Tax=Hydra vulgaris TaxID=6087 RepID=UPI000640E366|nr:galactose-3-O-sulfotransferase 3-like [Hydra vulgaris]